MNIYEAIKKDHEIQRDLCEQLKETEDKGKKERDKIYRELRKELKAHEVAEERYFYKPVIHTDKMIEDARHGMAEHHDIDELLRKLDDTLSDSDTWYDLAKELCYKVEHHLKDEEEEFFNRAKQVYSKNQEKELAEKYLSEMKEYRSEFAE